MTVAGPRNLVTTHAEALSVRGMIGIVRYEQTSQQTHLDNARDHAEAALVLAGRTRQLP